MEHCIEDSSYEDGNVTTSDVLDSTDENVTDGGAEDKRVRSHAHVKCGVFLEHATQWRSVCSGGEVVCGCPGREPHTCVRKEDATDALVISAVHEAVTKGRAAKLEPVTYLRSMSFNACLQPSSSSPTYSMGRGIWTVS